MWQPLTYDANFAVQLLVLTLGILPSLHQQQEVHCNSLPWLCLLRWSKSSPVGHADGINRSHQSQRDAMYLRIQLSISISLVLPKVYSLSVSCIPFALRPRGFFCGVSFFSFCESLIALALDTAAWFRSDRYEFFPT
jgi:hypothetical protein